MKLNRIAGTLVAVIAAVVLAACGESNDLSSRSSDTPRTDTVKASSTVRVLYEVEGTTDYASVTMETPTGVRQANPDVPMKLKDAGIPGVSYEFMRGDFVYISAQNKRAHGDITCRITVDGEIISENTSSGAYAIASCDGVAK